MTSLAVRTAPSWFRPASPERAPLTLRDELR
jgi:hypothetical protein